MARSYRGWLIAIALTGAFVDQVSKYIVFGWLYNHPTYYRADLDNVGEYEIVRGVFRLHVQYTKDPVQYGERPIFVWLQSWSSDKMPRVNHGALFGLFHEHKIAANYFFALVSIVAGLAIVGWSFRPNTSHDRLLCLALGLILAGTLGNLYDRIVFEGVRDFLHFYWFEWPVFNFADCCLVCGAFVLLAQAFLTHPAPNPAKNPVVDSVAIPASEVANAN
jgi:signal peptidase II